MSKEPTIISPILKLKIVTPVRDLPENDIHRAEINNIFADILNISLLVIII
jgi:hypothetical protein